MTEATARLFEAAKREFDTPRDVCQCERVLRALRRHLISILGSSAVATLFGQAVLEASSAWPIARQVKVASSGIDASALRQGCDMDGCKEACEACIAVVRSCLGIISTLSGDGVTSFVVARVEAELREFGNPLS